MNSTFPSLTADRLDVSRGDRCLFEGLSFALEAGQAALVTGPNGSGKTSLLRILAGLSPAAAGTVRYNGTPVGALNHEERHGIAYRGHLDGLKKDFTVRENLDFYRAVWGHTAPTNALLDELGLGAIQARRMRHLSAGQKRRLALATLKVCGADLWILDEPMTNLDAAGRVLVVDWVNEHLKGGGLAVIATHLAAEFGTSATLAIEL